MVVGRMVALAGVLVALAGCGSAQDSAPADSFTSAAASASTTTVASGPDLDVTIAGGQVTPVNAQLEAKVGQPITLRVTSDIAEELHVHAVPEHSFEVRPGAGETFEFTVDVPGRVEVELHALHRTVVTIQVRP
ncbi:MAG: hypothetical protein ABWY45_22050 [Mycobacterium sp.]